MPARRNRVQALTFDVGGTLIEPWPSVGHVYARVAARHGYGKISPESLNQQFAQAWQAKSNFNHSRADWRHLVHATFAGLAELPLKTDMFADLYEEFSLPGAWRIYPDVVPVLNRLQAAGMPMAIISNWDERLRPLLHQLDLHTYFEPIVISVEAGYVKPHKAIFELAIAVLGFRPEQVLHVGDGAVEDVAGAQGAGMQAFLLARAQGAVGGGVIGSLQDLPEVLGI